MLLIALAAGWLVLAAFVLTMCRVAARSDATRAGPSDGATPHSRRPLRAPPISRGEAPAQRQRRRSGLGVE
jgi:hypothetical protein